MDYLQLILSMLVYLAPNFSLGKGFLPDLRKNVVCITLSLKEPLRPIDNDVGKN